MTSNKSDFIHFQYSHLFFLIVRLTVSPAGMFNSVGGTVAKHCCVRGALLKLQPPPLQKSSSLKQSTTEKDVYNGVHIPFHFIFLCNRQELTYKNSGCILRQLGGQQSKQCMIEAK